MKYLKLFDTHTQYSSYIGGNPSLPNVSHCVQEDDMHYKPYDYSRDYLTFETLESGTFKFKGGTSANTLQYSLDNGNTWTTLAHNTDSPTIAAGSNVLWKGSDLTINNNGIGIFSSTGTFNAKGNVMSLLFSSNFRGQTSLSGKDKAYKYLFSGCTKMVSAENLILPATTLASSCYDRMFLGCSGLTTAPELPATTLAVSCYENMFNHCSGLTAAPVLPATTLANYCYRYMFANCANLSYIKAMFTATPGQSTASWLSGVASTGIFVKNSAAQWNVTGANGIPNNWTVVMASS